MLDQAMQRGGLAQARARAEAACALAALWEQLGDNAPVACLAVAHALADLQSRPSEELKWDLRALGIADRLTDAEREQAGVDFPMRALYPSLHLNAGDAFRKAGDLESALAHARLGREDPHARVGREALDALGADPYGGMLTEGFARLEARIRQAHAGQPVVSYS